MTKHCVFIQNEVSQRRIRAVRIFAITLALALFVACQSSHTSLPNQLTSTTPVTLSPGDTLKIAFPGASDLNQTQKVRADGKLNLPLIGEVTAGGKILMDFQNQLVQLYKPQLRNNQVLVTLESGVATVIVSGFVHKSGKFTFDRPTTVFQAIMEAGGPTDYGNIGNVRLTRTVNEQQRTEILNLKSAMSGRPTKAYYVKDGDVVFVSQRLF
ncbi:MAG TPA: polysaccharide biosynthesis/export family protein [Terriglobales bacterium]|nr:polysaccharide biosynthesis/export family protein [Terriglobales bacterium]